MGLQSTIVVLLASIAIAQGISEEDLREANLLSGAIESNIGPLNMTTVRLLSREKRDLLTKLYQDQLDRDIRSGSHGEHATVMLAMLGNGEARNRIVADWVRGHGGVPRTWGNPTDLIRLESPEAIAQIGELLFMNEEDQMPEDVGYTAPQKSALHVVANTLQKSPVFSPSVQTWANELLPLRDGMYLLRKGGLEAMRTWYRDNEARLKSGNFQVVQPGPSPPPEERPEPATAPASMANSVSPSIAATPVTEPALQPSERGSEWSFAAIAAVAVALLVGLGVFWKRRV